MQKLIAIGWLNALLLVGVGGTIALGEIHIGMYGTAWYGMEWLVVGRMLRDRGTLRLWPNPLKY